MTEEAFIGAKLILFLGARLVVIRRDDRPDIPWPGYLDLPGGGREGAETPETCALRETAEELGLDVDRGEIVWSAEWVSERGRTWSFAAHLPARRVADIRMGDEGTGWMLLTPAMFLARDDVVPHFQDYLRRYRRERS
ncbi:NUDIX hydrolase [Roseivivax sediminis]|uniref:8-oxo-dGTP diphosphatase n=1 Tax=Roseivivax sediminis TaxID=936889 RepID=A0A1I1ZZ44_9RHOB|nr:NUDIX hydrolase [Roseivivax sediminis]SFE36886.1 8-oxo-dGTP diphosphatase [Roseivivax sediminis]